MLHKLLLTTILSHAVLYSLSVRCVIQNSNQYILPVCFHSHDEIICEVDASSAVGDLAEAKHIMEHVPDWAAGLPLEVDKISQQSTYLGLD